MNVLVLSLSSPNPRKIAQRSDRGMLTDDDDRNYDNDIEIDDNAI